VFLQDRCGVIWSYQTIDENGQKLHAKSVSARKQSPVQPQAIRPRHSIRLSNEVIWRADGTGSRQDAWSVHGIQRIWQPRCPKTLQPEEQLT
jgi:hypothetical protein